MTLRFDSVFDLGEEVGKSGMSSLMGFAKGWESLFAKASDQTLRSLNDMAAVLEQSAGARSVEELAAIQSDFVRSAWKGAVAGSTELGGAAADMARDVVGPFESLGRGRR